MRKKSQVQGVGRPATIGADVTAVVRISKSMSDAVDAWARAARVTRSEAVRRLIGLGLERNALKRRTP